MMNDNYLLYQYDSALRNIMDTGFDIIGDRTAVGTRCKFGIYTEYDVSSRVPILTKRKIYWQSFVKEFLWYISGSSNINDLIDMGSNIWTPWINDEFSNKHGFVKGSGGYLYGRNLRHFGADLHDDSPDAGFNQLDYVIDVLKTNPANRQACFTFWRPDTNDKSLLPACHAFYSFVVSPDTNSDLTVLNLHITQRSADWPIGVGAGNLFIGTLFLYTIAQQVGMTPGMLMHTGVHCHIYHNTLDQVTEYLSRNETPSSPILLVNKKDSIYDYTVDDFQLLEYSPLPAIKFPIAI